MSNRPPLDLADRLCCVDPDEIRETMTPRQARQFERMRARHQHRLLGTLKWTAPPTPWAQIRGDRGSILAARHEQARARGWDQLWRCSLHHSVAAYCDPATCPRRHQRPRLHSIRRADLAQNLSQAGRTMVGLLGDR